MDNINQQGPFRLWKQHKCSLWCQNYQNSFGNLMIHFNCPNIYHPALCIVFFFSFFFLTILLVSSFFVFFSLKFSILFLKELWNEGAERGVYTCTDRSSPSFHHWPLFDKVGSTISNIYPVMAINSTFYYHDRKIYRCNDLKI